MLLAEAKSNPQNFSIMRFSRCGTWHIIGSLKAGGKSEKQPGDR